MQRSRYDRGKNLVKKKFFIKIGFPFWLRVTFLKKTIIDWRQLMSFFVKRSKFIDFVDFILRAWFKKKECSRVFKIRHKMDKIERES